MAGLSSPSDGLGQRPATGPGQYAYAFDFDVMHPYMVRAFTPFFREGTLLELGSGTGMLTTRLRGLFDAVTCVECDDAAVVAAAATLGDAVTLVRAPVESVQLDGRFDNVVVTHVLEHLDDPVAVLRRVADEWLADGARAFLACPNAHAPSRQIAVRMGLLSHATAVTEAERAHGHRRTYTLEALEQDALAAGMRVLHRSGIFFKALANYQWDRLLGTDVISEGYLDGCYALGQQYPDLCSSVFVVCEARGRP